MYVPSNSDAFEVLCLQAANDGRGPVLFGDNVDIVRKEARPFMLEGKFPSVYLECPLIGDPFLDVTMLYSQVDSGVRIASKAAEGTEELIDWFSSECSHHPGVCFGFELDTKEPQLPKAAVHFQPRAHHEFVKPFCAVVGEPERAKLYLDFDRRLPEQWELSFFGMFRGRPNSPLRVCGYLVNDEAIACAHDPHRLVHVFDEAGFTHYDDTMIGQICEFMAAAPDSLDFQFDLYPDGTTGDVFALDVKFGIAQPEAVCESFSSGAGARIMHLLEKWGVADERWKLGAQVAFARKILVMLEDESIRYYGFTLMPLWVKVRWKNGILQPSKLYFLGRAGLLDDK